MCILQVAELRLRTQKKVARAHLWYYMIFLRRRKFFPTADDGLMKKCSETTSFLHYFIQIFFKRSGNDWIPLQGLLEHTKKIMQLHVELTMAAAVLYFSLLSL
jgi:hypothetical protein